MSTALLVADSGVSLTRSPLNGIIGSTSVGVLSVAAARSGTSAVGTMDTTPTETEVEALQQIFTFSPSDDVKSVLLHLAINNPGTSAVQAVHARINGYDAFADASELAACGDGVVVIMPNTPVLLSSSTAITRIAVCATPSSVTSGNYEGAKLYLKGYSHA